MRPNHAAPATVEDAVRLLIGDSNGVIIAGGTDLIPEIRAGRRSPSQVVDLRLLPLTDIVVEADRIRVGARVTFADILTSDAIEAEFPALVEAAAQLGGPPIRNRATLGGNLVNASPAADGAPPLLAYDASVAIVGLGGEREVPLPEFFHRPGQTVLIPGEILTEIRMPRPEGHTTSSFMKYGPRNAMAISVVSVAVRVTGDGLGGVDDTRIALGAVAPTPIRAEGAERIVTAEGLGTDAVASASAAAAEACSPIGDIRSTAEYRRHLVEVLVRRLLTGAALALEGSNA